MLVGDSGELRSSALSGRGLPREGATIVDPLTMQILRRTGTEGTVRQKARKDNSDRKGMNDDVPNEGIPGVLGVLGGLSPDISRHMDVQPQVKEKKFVFLSIQLSARKQARLTKHLGRAFLSSAA